MKSIIIRQGTGKGRSTNACPGCHTYDLPQRWDVPGKTLLEIGILHEIGKLGISLIGILHPLQETGTNDASGTPHQRDLPQIQLPAGRG